MRQKRTEGLSLLEVLIALVVVMIAFMVLASAQVGSITASNNARDISRARDFADQVLAEQRSRVILEIVAPTVGVTDPTNAGMLQFLNANFSNYFGPPTTSTCPRVTTIQSPNTFPFRGSGVRQCTGRERYITDRYAETRPGGTIQNEGFIASWMVGPAPRETLTVGNPPRSVTVADDAVAMVLVRVDWSRGSRNFSLSQQQFVSCLDINRSIGAFNSNPNAWDRCPRVTAN